MNTSTLSDGTEIARTTVEDNRKISTNGFIATVLSHLASMVAVFTTALKGQVTGYLSLASGTQVQVKYLNTTVAAAQTDASLVAAVTGKKIRVLQLSLDCAGTATVATLQSAGTAKAGPFNQAVSEQTVLPYSPHGWFETVAGEALKITTGAGATTTVTLAYAEI